MQCAFLCAACKLAEECACTIRCLEDCVYLCSPPCACLEPGALSLVRLNCTDYCDVDESLMQYVMLQRLGVSCDPSPRPAASADANTTTNGTDSSIAQSSPQPACEEFKPSLSVSLGAR